MANSKQAKKRARQAVNNREHNMSLRSRMRTYIKRTQKAIGDGDHAAAQASFKEAMPIIDSMVNKGIIHRNKAARHKKQLNAGVKSLQA